MEKKSYIGRLVRQMQFLLDSQSPRVRILILEIWESIIFFGFLVSYLRMDAKENSKTILLKFKKETPGQTNWKSWKLPQGRRETTLPFIFTWQEGVESYRVRERPKHHGEHVQALPVTKRKGKR